MFLVRSPGFEPGITSLEGNTEAFWNNFKTWVFSRYSKVYAGMVCCYAKKYHQLINGNLYTLDSLKSEYVKTLIIKSLIILSKFLGQNQDFKKKLKDFGIKAYKPDSFASFLRILNNNSGDLLNWYRQTLPRLRDNEKLLLKFTLVAGLRRSEAIASFNKIIELAKKNRISEYYDSDLQCLQHFKYKETFLRKTKNCYISFVSKDLISAIADSTPVTYPAIRKRLEHRCRINELRDYYGTFMVRHGLIREEVDLLQGRIPPSIFIRHYWSPSFKELRDRTLKAITELEQTLN